MTDTASSAHDAPGSRGCGAVVGGVSYAVGGWGEHEITRRRVRYELLRERPGWAYEGRSYVGADDAVRSVLARSRERGGTGTKSALQRAALRLADSLGRLEDLLCAPSDEGVWECAAAEGKGEYLTVPPVTSADLRSFAESPEQMTDPDAMYDLDRAVAILAASRGDVASAIPMGRTETPALPTRSVPVGRDRMMLRLEASVGPYVATVERIQAALAGKLDNVATFLDSGRKG